MDRECSRCGTWLSSDEGICPTCGEVYGNQTIFQMPQISRDMSEADLRRLERESASAPRAASPPRAARPRAPAPAPVPEAADPEPVDVNAETAPMRTRPPQVGPTTTAMPQLPPGAQRPAGKGPSFVVLMVAVLVGALVVGVVVGLIIL